MYAFTKYDLNGKHYLTYGNKPLIFYNKKSICRFARQLGIDKSYIEEITDPNEIQSLESDIFENSEVL